MAFKSWNSKTNTVSYDRNIYDTSSNTWIRDYSYPQQQIPSAQESYEEFEKHISLNKENNSGTLTVEYKGIDQLDRLINVLKNNY